MLLSYRQVIPTVWGISFAIFVVFRMLHLKKLVDGRPRSADPSKGRTYPIRVMSETLYVTDEERDWFERSNRLVRWFGAVGFISFFIALVVLPLLLHHYLAR